MKPVLADMLREAALKGVPQIKGTYQDGFGYCAMGIIRFHLATLAQIAAYDELRTMGVVHSCPAPNRFCRYMTYATEEAIIVHLNDQHGWDFLTIANKLEEAV